MLLINTKLMCLKRQSDKLDLINDIADKKVLDEKNIYFLHESSFMNAIYIFK